MSSPGLSRNHVLDSLVEADFQLLKPHLTEITLFRDRVISEPDSTIDTVYFPIGAVLSVIVMIADGQCVEACTIGDEGAYGVLHALGSPVVQDRVLAQVPGACLIMPGTQLRAAANQSPRLSASLISHVQASVAQAHQSVACNALHDVDGRLRRWLLMSQDRTRNAVLPLTQEYLATMLGVQRTTVTSAARALQAKGLIRYSRGRIEILDRAGLEDGACDCYAAVLQKQAQLVAPRR